MRITFIFILVSFNLILSAQSKLKQNAAFTIRGNVGIPKTISSKLFNTCFKGVVESNLSANVRVFNNVFAGLGYQNSFFQNNKYIFKNQITPQTTLPYDTKLLIHSGFIKIGYDYFFSEIGYISCAINTGYGFAAFNKVLTDTSINNQPYVNTKFNAPFIQPEFGVNFIAEDILSFSFMISYNNMLYRFDPKAPRFAHFQQVSELVKANRNKYIMSWLNIGFGFNILID